MPNWCSGNIEHNDKEKKPINVNFDIDIDLLQMRKSIIKKAEDQIINVITKDIETIMFSHRNSFSVYRQDTDVERRNGINEPVKDIIVEFMEKYKEEIINRTADTLTKRLVMSKEIKELKKNAELV